MALASGTRLGAYEIGAPLGKGGMGEVYRARDTKLGREVALKVLPEELSRDETRVARFEREARLLASVNHPNIASLYGVEESEGRTALVLELIDGPTLAERLAEGPLPLDEAVAVARQIASALEAGHEAGVIHRDLKPSNVKVKDGGTVKVLDYGLARALDTDGGAEPSSDLSQSPTLARQGTAVGVILGTAAYMSPEQAKGKRADPRADIWAFGAVLFEMLTAKPLFTGETVSDVLGAVLREELDWSRLPADTPEPIRRLLRRSLTRDLARRLPHIGAARLELDEALASPAPQETNRSRLWIGVAAALGLLAGLGLDRILAPPRPPPSPIRASIALPPGTQLAFGPFARQQLAVSPDGSTLAFVAVPLGTTLVDEMWTTAQRRETRIYVQRLDNGETMPLRDTDGAMHIFFSPDGRSLGFFAEGELKTIPVSGGAPVRICPVSTPWGALWLKDDRIVFLEPRYREEGGNGLFVVSAHGGERSVYSAPDPSRGELDHEFPTAIPGSADLLITMWVAKSYPNARVGLLPAGGGPVTHLFDGGSHAQAFGDHIVYARTPQLLAVPFDAKRGQLTGPPHVLLDDLLGEPSYLAPQFALSPSGVLVWAAGEAVDGSGRLFRLQPSGAPDVELLVADARIRQGNLFPGGSLVALDVTGETGDDVYAYEIENEALTRVSSGISTDGVAAPDGNAIFYDSPRGLLRQDLNRQNPSVISNEISVNPKSVSADSLHLAYAYVEKEKSDWDIGILDVATGIGRPFLATAALERNPMFSPTSPVIAFESDRSQRLEIWLQRFDPHDVQPVADAPVRVSRDGGTKPFWSADGRTLYFTSADDRIMAAEIEVTSGIPVARPVEAMDLGSALRSTSGIARLDVFGQDKDGRFLAVGFPPTPSITKLETIFHFRPNAGGRRATR